MTTNVPGPRFPLYVLGKRMVSAHAYVPIAGGTRCSIGIFSYLNTMTFGINADFDGFPDVDVLSGGHPERPRRTDRAGRKQAEAEARRGTSRLRPSRDAASGSESAPAKRATAAAPRDGPAGRAEEDSPRPAAR